MRWANGRAYLLSQLGDALLLLPYCLDLLQLDGGQWLLGNGATWWTQHTTVAIHKHPPWHPVTIYTRLAYPNI